MLETSKITEYHATNITFEGTLRLRHNQTIAVVQSCKPRHHIDNIKNFNTIEIGLFRLFSMTSFKVAMWNL